MYYIKPTLKNLSQGARLEYVRKYRHMSADDVAEYFGLGAKIHIKLLIVMKLTTGVPVKEG